MIRNITNNDKLLAIVIKRHFPEPGVHFVTPHEFSQQLALMRHPAGKTIQPHVHNTVEREVSYTQEVLFITKGKIRADFYDESRNYLESYILEAGDVILLASGGHGFEVLEEIEMIEVKQGPFSEDKDKTRFEGIGPGQVIVRDWI